ncbi:MAG: PfkB family carbohydrate kinase [Gallionella sp.]|nr:PfkB family carbohydrate kinase [Gallionella sp.]
MLHIVGGVYRELCMHPKWCEVYGSAGRAASAIAQIGGDATLHTYLDSLDAITMEIRAALEGFCLQSITVPEGVGFNYHHTLSAPILRAPAEKYNPIRISQDKVIRFGMIEGSAIVKADYAVYDPQNIHFPEEFHENGSKANHLAIVLNHHEASVVTGLSASSPEDMARNISLKSKAEVVVIKMGPRGALVYEKDTFTQIPAFKTARVWKIGSGDNFVAIFAYYWMEQRLKAAEAALLASKATAFYCENRGFVTDKNLNTFNPEALQLSDRYLSGYKPLVYLAGPFFTLAELWLVEQARNNLNGMGLRVFSPYHDVGHGSADDVVELDLKAIHECDIVLAIGDGLDAGTIYEVGYARSLEKPVIFYSENESSEDKKMMLGSNCILCEDYVTAIYKTLWTSAEI